MIKVVSDDKDLLKTDIKKLLFSAKSLKIVMSDKENDKHIKDLYEKFAEVDKKRTKFVDEIKKLVGMLKAKK